LSSLLHEENSRMAQIIKGNTEIEKKIKTTREEYEFYQ
jgi:hypothetical protein